MSVLSVIPIYIAVSILLGIVFHVAIEKPWYIVLTHAEKLVLGAVRRAVNVDAVLARMSALLPPGVELKKKKDK